MGGSVTDVMSVIHSLSFMVCMVMSPTASDEVISDVEHSIKIFLTSFEKFDAGLQNKKEKPMWVTSYNFPCLLNLPETMRVFGPLPNLWEGGGQGEKVLQLVKPLWNGFRSRWHVNLLDRVLNDMALK
jgi:hypothetical protein